VEPKTTFKYIHGYGALAGRNELEMLGQADGHLNASRDDATDPSEVLVQTLGHPKQRTLTVEKLSEPSIFTIAIRPPNAH